jgi:Flp pilus assembly protein TadD
MHENDRENALKFARRAAAAPPSYVMERAIRISEVLYWANCPEEAAGLAHLVMEKSSRHLKEMLLAHGREFLPATLIVELYERYLAPDLKVLAAVNCCIDALTAVGRADEAGRLFEKAISSNPTNIALRRNYAKHLADAGRLADAVAQSEALVSTFPDDARIRRQHARLLKQSGREDEARAAMTIARSLASESDRSSAD